MRLLRGVLTVAAIVGLGFALQRAVQDAGAVSLPGPARLSIAALLLAVSLVTSASAWSTLLPTVGLRLAFPGFVVAQLAKYVPGSVWQGVGQVADAHRLGVATGTASVSFLVQLALQVVAAGIASAAALMAPELPWWLRIVAILGPGSVIFVNRRWLATALAFFARRSSRLRQADIELPSQPTLVRGLGWSGVTIVAIGLSYASLLPTTSDPREVVGTAGVFMLAWLIGFLVVPLPAGVGVREAVLVAGLSAMHPVADVLAAAIIARLLLIVVEGVLAATGQLLRLGPKVGDGSS